MQGILDFLVSFWQLTTRVIFARKARVLFYYPQHFNRTAEGTNPFFDRLLEACDRHGISYKLIEEPDWGTDKPRNPKAIKGDVLFLMIVVLRKIIGRIHIGSKYYEDEQRVVKFINVLTFGRLLCPQYVSISGSMNELFIYLNPKGNVYEMQHGVVFGGKDAFYESDGSLHPTYKESNFHLLFWGEGYRRCTVRGHEKEWKSRTHVVGYPLNNKARILNKSQDDSDSVSADTILISMQITNDSSEKWANGFIEMVEDCLNQLNELIGQGFNFKVLLKHHPRFNNAYNIDYLFDKYPFAELTEKPLSNLLPHTMLHVTYHSTTAFECAQYGVPSFFMQSQRMLQGIELFYDEYQYPLYAGMSFGDVVKRLKKLELRKQDSVIVKKWYQEFYDEFDENAFIKLIK